MARVEIISPGGYGTRQDGILHDRGSVIELDDAVAVKLVGYGMVRILPDPEPAVETAAKAPPQNAAKRTGKTPPRKMVT
jgi:hypothetical protein